MGITILKFISVLGPVQTSNFPYSELNDNIKTLMAVTIIDRPISLHCGPRLGKIQVRRLIQTSNLISPTRFIFTMYNGLQCLPVKINYGNVCIRLNKVRRLKLSRSTVAIPMWTSRP